MDKPNTPMLLIKYFPFQYKETQYLQCAGLSCVFQPQPLLSLRSVASSPSWVISPSLCLHSRAIHICASWFITGQDSRLPRCWNYGVRQGLLPLWNNNYLSCQSNSYARSYCMETVDQAGLVTEMINNIMIYIFKNDNHFTLDKQNSRNHWGGL